MTDQRSRQNRFWGDKTLPTSKAEFFNAITSPAPTGEGKIATIRMYGPIDSWGGFWGISAKDVAEVLAALGDNVEQIILRVNSPGGEVHEGISILNMFRAHKASVLAVVDGLAGSIASCIAAGADETVMSPGTNMAIHKPWGIEIGNADDLRKHAAILDTLEASLTEIYRAKAGDKDWATLLSEETWMTANEAVEMGLADRVAVVPDAGETETVSDQELVVVIDDDSDSVRVTKIAAGLRPAAALPPRSPEPVETQKKEDRVSDTLKAGLLERLGITDAADLTDDAILAQVDEVVEKATAPAPKASVPAVPEGSVIVESEAYAGLQRDAAMGREAREEQNKNRREATVDKALAEGRIAPASREKFLDLLEKDEAGTAALLATFAPNTVPVTELGGADEAELSEDDRLFAKAGWTEPKKEA